MVDVVRKSEFAQLCGVTAGRVSQWISSGQIGAEALVGEGRSAMINVDLARDHLQRRLDVKQRFSLNGIDTELESRPRPAAASPPEHVDTVDTLYKAEKLRQAQLATRRAEEDDRLRRGVYIKAADARDEMTRIASKLFEAFEGALPDFASEVSGKHQIPQRDILHLLRAEMRKFRERVADEYAASADAEEEFVGDAETHDAITLQ